jgi:hypothetical protein
MIATLKSITCDTHFKCLVCGNSFFNGDLVMAAPDLFEGAVTDKAGFNSAPGIEGGM